jgi:hypothetical protein
MLDLDAWLKVTHTGFFREPREGEQRILLILLILSPNYTHGGCRGKASVGAGKQPAGQCMLGLRSATGICDVLWVATH